MIDLQLLALLTFIILGWFPCEACTKFICDIAVPSSYTATVTGLVDSTCTSCGDLNTSYDCAFSEINPDNQAQYEVPIPSHPCVDEGPHNDAAFHCARVLAKCEELFGDPDFELSITFRLTYGDVQGSFEEEDCTVSNVTDDIDGSHNEFINTDDPGFDTWFTSFNETFALDDKGTGHCSDDSGAAQVTVSA